MLAFFLKDSMDVNRTIVERIIVPLTDKFLRTSVSYYKEFEGIAIQTLFFAITKHFLCITNKAVLCNVTPSNAYSQIAKDSFATI